MTQVILLAEHVPADLAEFFESADVERERGSVLKISSSGYPGAHFATFPPNLIIPMIKAGTSEHGCCAECGAPWERVTEEKTVFRERPNAHVKYKPEGADAELDDEGYQGGGGPNGQPDQRKAGVEVKTVGWRPTCECRFYRLRDDVPQGILDELRSLGVL